MPNGRRLGGCARGYREVMSGVLQSLSGPNPWSPFFKKYGVAVGAAQTFGRFCPKAYPQLVWEATGVSVVNLGFAGAGPRMFLRPGPLSLINQAAFVIVQVMSSRSLGNSVFECLHDGGAPVRRATDADGRFTSLARAVVDQREMTG